MNIDLSFLYITVSAIHFPFALEVFVPKYTYSITDWYLLTRCLEQFGLQPKLKHLLSDFTKHLSSFYHTLGKENQASVEKVTKFIAETVTYYKHQTGMQ